MKDTTMVIICLLFCFGGFAYLVYDSETNYKWVEVKETHTIKNKQTIRESTNNFGAFREEYKFLLENGELKDVELNEYMNYESGDTIVLINNYRQEK